MALTSDELLQRFPIGPNHNFEDIHGKLKLQVTAHNYGYPTLREMLGRYTPNDNTIFVPGKFLKFRPVKYVVKSALNHIQAYRKSNRGRVSRASNHYRRYKPY